MAKRHTAEEKQKHNEQLRTLYGDTMTRSQMSEYQTAYGVFPSWIYADPSAKLSRGLYRIPGGETTEPKKRTSKPKKQEPKPEPKPAPEAVARPVIPTPFDDGTYDEPEEKKSEPVEYYDGTNIEFKKEQKPRENVKTSLTTGEEISLGEKPLPVFIHGWVCSCGGRKTQADANYVPGEPVLCVCGKTMQRHFWTKRTKRTKS